MSRYNDLIPQKIDAAPVKETSFLGRVFGSKPAPSVPTPVVQAKPVVKNSYSDLIPAGGNTSVKTTAKATSRYSDLVPKATEQVPEVQKPSIFSKAKEKVGNTVSDLLAKEAKFIEPPTQEELKAMPKDTTALGYTLKFLPSEIARSLPIVGYPIAALQDNPELVDYIEPSDFVKEFPSAVVTTAKEIAKAPVRVGLGLYGAATGKQKSVNIPGLGEAQSYGKTVLDRINEGESPVLAAISEGSSAIFDLLFFAGAVQSITHPRPVITAETKVDATPYLKPEAIDRATPKSFRLYQEKVSATPLPPEAIAKMKAQGVAFGEKFDPSRPTYFRMSYEAKGQTFKGTIVQLKPSWYQVVKSKFKGNPAKAPDQAFLPVAPPRETTKTEIMRVIKEPGKAVAEQNKTTGKPTLALPSGKAAAPSFGRYSDLVKEPGASQFKAPEKPIIPAPISPASQSTQNDFIGGSGEALTITSENLPGIIEKAKNAGSEKLPATAAAKGVSQEDVIQRDPNLNLKRDVVVTDIQGNKATITEGEALSAYELKGGKVLLKDGKTYVVTKNQYLNIKNNSKIAGEGKDFAPELKGLTETINQKTEVAPGVKLTKPENEELNTIAMKMNHTQLTDKEASRYNELMSRRNEETKIQPDNTRYKNYTLPDGKKYREVLIKVPVKYGEMKKPHEINNEKESETFKSSHWEDPNVLAHVRLNIREYKGQEVTFIEEVQSDWAREGRSKGFIEDNVDALKKELNIKMGEMDKEISKEGLKMPSSYNSLEVNTKTQDFIASSKKLTELKLEIQKLKKRIDASVPNHPQLKNWTEIAVKRSLKEAVENDSAYLAWINGEQTSARYNLATQVDKVNWYDPSTAKTGESKTIELTPLRGGKRLEFSIDKKGVITSVEDGTTIGWKGKQLDEVIGKGLADKIMEKEAGDLSGDGLAFGGEWAKNLYDKQIKSIVENLTGGKVITIDMGLGDGKKMEPMRNADIKSTDFGTPLKESDIKVKHEIEVGTFPTLERYIITDVLGDGKFMAVEKKFYDSMKGRWLDMEKDQNWESRLDVGKKEFSISGKKSEGQQALKLTPEIKAIIKGEAPKIKEPSNESPFTKNEDTKSTPKEDKGAQVKDQGNSGGGSKVTKTVYRGTHSKGELKMSDETDYGDGYYFADKKETAAEYGKNVGEYTVSLKNPLTIKDRYEMNNIVDDFLSLKEQGKTKFTRTNDYLKSQGYDGIIVKNGGLGGEDVGGFTIAFDKSQINEVNSREREIRDRVVKDFNYFFDNREAPQMVRYAKSDVSGTEYTTFRTKTAMPDQLPEHLRKRALFDKVEPYWKKQERPEKKGLAQDLYDELYKMAEGTVKEEIKQENKPIYKQNVGDAPFSMGSYKDGTPVELAKMDGINPIEFPELVDLARELMGNVPLIQRMRAARGKFRAGMGQMDIILDPELFSKDPEHFAKTLAHEIGHLIDYLPDHSLDRGNLIGRLKVMHSFMKEAFGSEGALDMTKIRSEATKEARKEMNLKSAQEPPYPEMLKKLIKEKIDAKITEQGGIRNSTIRQELIDVTQYWKPFDDKRSSESYTRYRYSSKELYADAISVLFNSPGTLESKAPTFFKEFFEGLDKKPAVFNAYFDLQSILGGDREALVARRREGVRKMFDTGDYKAAELQKVREEEKKLREKDLMFKLKFELMDKNQAVIDRINQAKKNGITISDDENPLYYLEERNYLGGKIKAIMEKDFNPIYKGVQEAGITWTDFGESLFYDRIASGDRSDYANPRGITPDAAKELDIALYKSLGTEKGIELDKFKEQFRENMRKVSEEAYQEGLYTPEMYSQMKENPAYATFQVMDYIDKNMSAKIHKSVGTLKDVTNPADATLMKMVATVKAIERNKVTRSTVSFLQKQFPGDVKPADVRWNGRSRVPVKSQNVGEELVTHMVQGKQVGHYVDPYIAKSLQNETVGQNLAVTKVMASMNTNLFRPLFIGYNLGFQAFNFFRDFLRFYKNIPGLTFTGAMGRYIQAMPVAKVRAFGVKDPEALTGMMKKAYDTMVKLEHEQVLSVTFNDIVSGEDDFDRQIDRIMANSGIESFEDKKGNIFWKPFRTVLHAIKESGDFIETLPKAAGYYEISKNQGGELTREQKSFIRKNIGSPDFLAGGHLKPATNEVFLFSNAITQGIRSDIEVATDPRTRSGYWYKTAKVSLLPKILMLAAAVGLLGEELKKLFENVSEYDATNYTIVPLGEDENGKTVYMRLPQDEGGRFIGGMFWKLLTAPNNDQNVYKDMADILSFTGGNVPNLSPTIKVTGAITQYLAGQNPYDTFRNRNVLTDDQYKAGGMYAAKPFMGWIFNELGGGIFYRFSTSGAAPKDQSSAEKIFNLPVFGNIVGRFVKVSDYGTTEKLNKIKANVQSEQSARRIDENVVINKYVKEAQQPNAKMRMAQIKKQMINEIFGGEPKDAIDIEHARSLVAKWQLGIQKGSGSPELKALISAQTNEEKILLVQEIRKRLSVAEYEQLKKDVLKNRIASPEVFSKAEKGQK